MSELDPPGVPDDATSPWFIAAARRVRTPGAVLQWFGLISLILTVASIVFIVLGGEEMLRWLHDLVEKSNAQQPAGQGLQLGPVDDFVRTYTIQLWASSVLALLGSGAMYYGGLKMKRLDSYSWAMAAAILGTIATCTNCGCVSMPFGVWALVVLLNSDVKLAFARKRAGFC